MDYREGVGSRTDDYEEGAVEKVRNPLNRRRKKTTSWRRVTIEGKRSEKKKKAEIKRKGLQMKQRRQHVKHDEKEGNSRQREEKDAISRITVRKGREKNEKSCLVRTAGS